VQDPVVPGLFATTGLAQNVGIRLQASAGEMLDNGTEQVAPVVLQNGNNTVTFAAMYEATAASVTTGEADSVANFTVAYN
jgi:major type 1 subunit fimbrin (pilin)